MIIAPGTTGKIVHVFIKDATVSTGAGKTGLAFGDITAYYVRAGGTLTAMTMETIATLGTWASSGANYLGFKLLHDTNAPGLYELHLPNNVLASGASQVVIQLRATDAMPCNLEIQLGVVADSVTGAVGSVTGAVGSVTGNVGGSVASVTGAVGSVTGDVGGNVLGFVVANYLIDTETEESTIDGPPV